MEILNNPVVSEISKIIIAVLAGVILANMRKILKRITLIEYKLHATDYALEKSFENGYANYRDSKLQELIESDDFINNK
ncbi:MAG: hypothetical protein K8I03_14575 [Ignavibacteria bacterium]|nr:hypothetical protein [Ignavibacteria bacterium]